MSRAYMGAIMAAVALFGCATGSQRPQALPLPPQRITQPGYSLLPLDEKGWVAGPRDQRQMMLGRHGSNPDETIAIQGIAFPLPAFHSIDEFVRVVREGQAVDTDHARFQVLKHEVVADSSRQATCARSHLITEDSGAAKRTATAGAMVLEVATLTCAHPGRAGLGISVIYSHRYYAGQADPAFMEKADRVMGSVELTGL